MRAFLRWAALVAAVALITSAVVHAQTIGGDGTKAQSLGFTRIGGITASDSIGRILKMDANGYLYQKDADRDRDLIMGQGSIINAYIGSANRTDSLAYGADSCIAMPIGNARHVTLWIDAKTTTAKDVRLAVQFRVHYSGLSDSSSVASVMPSQMFGYASGRTFVAASDSIGDIVAAATGQARSNEVLLVWRATGGFGGSANAEWSAPRAKILTYEVPAGVGAYFSVRIRNLSRGYANIGVGNATQATVEGHVRIAVSYKASAL